MRNKRVYLYCLFPAVLMIMALSIWGPEVLARYRDKAILGGIHTGKVDTEGEGYRYKLSSSEKLYILSESLNSQTLPESEQSAQVRIEGTDMGYRDLEGTYAFIVNHRGTSGKEISVEEIYETCNRGLDALKEYGILPDAVKKVEAADYETVLYSAIDVLEPTNNVVVWKLSLSDRRKNASRENRLIDAYIDADDGRIYEFYARTSLTWEGIDPDAVMRAWSEYMGLEEPEPYESSNPLMEATPYFRKYVFRGMGEEKTVATIGFYEGIDELFIKISK